MRFDVRKLTAALAVAGLAGAASPAMAQNTHIPSWVLTPYVSGFGVDGAYGVGGSDALKGIGGGLSLGKSIADDFELQLNVSHARRKEVRHYDAAFLVEPRPAQGWREQGRTDARRCRRVLLFQPQRVAALLRAGRRR